jgi:tRNA (cmo5U34)-methyltransferase
MNEEKEPLNDGMMGADPSTPQDGSEKNESEKDEIRVARQQTDENISPQHQDDQNEPEPETGTAFTPDESEADESEPETTSAVDSETDLTPQLEELEHKTVIATDATVWKNASLVESYLKRIRKGLPMAEAQIDVMMRVIEGRGRPVQNFMDLGCGDGVLAAAVLSEYPEATGVLVDFSMPMIDAALRNLKDYTQTLHFTNLNYADPSWFKMVSQRGPFDVIVSGYSIQHQTDAEKKQIYADLFDLLEPGGVFVNMEQVASSTPWVMSLHDNFFIDSLWVSQVSDESARSRAQVAEAYHSRPDKAANVLAPVEKQCHWLRQIGFEDVDCYFKAFELAVFGGRRPGSDGGRRTADGGRRTVDG